MTQSLNWAVGIFAARESTDTLARCVHAAIEACAGKSATIDVLINGNLALAEEFAERAKSLDCPSCNLRVWSIAAPDKAHTWNEYIFRIGAAADVTYFIDGYAEVRADALAEIDRKLAMTPNALGASGVPTCGRSATKLRTQMVKSGGIHGNLYAINAEGLSLIRRTGFKLPLGLYRTDALVGAALNFRLDPASTKWDPKRIAIVESATWHVAGIATFTFSNVKTQLKRLVRQAQGVLENRAVHEHMAVKRLGPQSLPVTAQAMILEWVDKKPEQSRSLFIKQPLCGYVMRHVRSSRDWSTTEIAPTLLLTKGGL